MKRRDGRKPDALRDIAIEKSFLNNAHGSALITWGSTRVICSAMYKTGVPPFLEGTGKGWLTAEYAMLPGSTQQRKQREKGRPDGRGTEISRLIGRSLRSVFDIKAVPDYTIHIDCDVIDADGGTRTASITGAYIAVTECIDNMIAGGLIESSPIREGFAAVSCGVVSDVPLIDLDYSEDSRADADMNIVMAHGGGIIEVQGTGERRPMQRGELDTLLAYAQEGIKQIQQIQKEALGQA